MDSVAQYLSTEDDKAKKCSTNTSINTSSSALQIGSDDVVLCSSKMCLDELLCKLDIQGEALEKIQYSILYK